MRTVRSFGIAIIPKAFKSMPLSRHSARSFTFEIKRANRRRPEVVAVSKSLSHASPLADEVFGTSSADRATKKPAGQANVSAGIWPSDVLPDNTAPSPRRVLPDLFSIQVDPVAERMQRLAHERATRREHHGQCASRFRRRNRCCGAGVTGNATVSSGAVPQEHQTANPAGETLRPPRPLSNGISELSAAELCRQKGKGGLRLVYLRASAGSVVSLQPAGNCSSNPAVIRKVPSSQRADACAFREQCYWRGRGVVYR